MRINHLSRILIGATSLTGVLLAGCSGGGGASAATGTTGGTGGTGGTGSTSASSVTVTSSSSNLSVGSAMGFNATPRDAGGNIVGGTITWSTSADAVAYVTSTGTAYGISAGTATISAQTGAVSGSKVITVAAPSTTPSTGYVLATGGTTFFPTNITVARGGTVTFIFAATTHNVTYNAVTGRPSNIGDVANTESSSTFPTVGTFSFTCTLHPGMSGTITVI